ncbi:uncharacterized protein [Euwallacea similis]|uniref:uncharacterized protein isoform X2 n=1 Tax=Euwallacea similis TaxID=1736056 RepID=UPI00344FACBB
MNSFAIIAFAFLACASANTIQISNLPSEQIEISNLPNEQVEISNLPSDIGDGIEISNLPSEIETDETEISHLPAEVEGEGIEISHLPADIISGVQPVVEAEEVQGACDICFAQMSELIKELQRTVV